MSKLTEDSFTSRLVVDKPFSQALTEVIVNLRDHEPGHAALQTVMLMLPYEERKDYATIKLIKDVIKKAAKQLDDQVIKEYTEILVKIW